MSRRASRIARLAGAAIIIAVLAGAIAVRLVDPAADLWFSNPSYANDLSLNFEEKASALAARNWILFGDIDSYGGIYQPQAFMPLGFLIHAAWYAVAGVSIVATRMPFAIIAALTLAAMAWTARWQLSLPALAVFVVLAGFNPTLVAWQRSSLDENLMLTGLVAMALCAPAPFARPYAFALWGLVAIVAAAAKPTGLVFAAAPVLAMAWDLARERRGEAIRPLAALAAGVAVAAGLTLALYAACGYFRPGPFQGWLAEYNRSLGFVPPLDGLAEYVAAVGHHLPIPASTEAAILVLALAAPFLLAETTFFTRAAWCGLVLALAAGAPFYLYYKRLVPVVPLVFYLACAGAQGLAWRAHHGVTQMRRARPRAAPGAAEPPRVATVHFDAASDPRATSGEFARRIATVVWSLAALTAIRVVLAAAGDGIRETFTDHRDRPAMPAYGALADRFNAAIPPGTVLAAPDSFRVVAFDTPFAYRFTHDMVARHMEHIALDEAVRRDARAAGATVLLLPDDDPADPGRHRFRLVGPAGDGLASSRTSAGEIHP